MWSRARGLMRRRDSIREFCEPDMPIYMFDRHGNFMVLTLEQVSAPGAWRERGADARIVAAAVVWP